MAASKLHSHFSIDNILRKEQKTVVGLHKTSDSSSSDVSLPEEENALERWKKDLLSECNRDCCLITKEIRDDLPVLQSRHKLTEHWVYENQRQRSLPILFPHTFPPILPPKRPSYSSSSDIDLIPSPSPTPHSTWSSPPPLPPPPPPPTHHAKRHSLDYWFLERMNRYHRSTSLSEHPYYWHSPTSYLDERNAFSGILGRPRLKSNLTITDDDSDEGNRKGGQVRFTHAQSTELERIFSLQKYVSPQERKQLARSIDLSERQVKTWFQNRRAKWRRIKLEDEMRVRMVTENSSLSSSLPGKLNDTHDLNREESATILKKQEHDDNDYRLQYRCREDGRIC